jgi:hypothetical protein
MKIDAVVTDKGLSFISKDEDGLRSLRTEIAKIVGWNANHVVEGGFQPGEHTFDIQGNITKDQEGRVVAALKARKIQIR